MSAGVVIAIDQGTTSVRATVLTASASALAPVASASETIPRDFPRPGWVELDARLVVDATERVVASALAKAGLRASDVAAMGLANQGETVVAWDRATGEPIAPAVGWQCRRTEPECHRLRAEPDLEARVRRTTGLPIDPYFSATKLAWLLDDVPGARARAERGEIVGGTLDAFTLFRLSRGRLFVTDPSTSCRTLLARLDSGRFDPALCEVFRVPERMLPEVVASDADLGTVSVGGHALSVRAILCDQPSALLGTGCLAPGDAKCTYGTGAFLQVRTGAPRVESDGLLRSIAWEAFGERAYLLEGGVLAAGDVLTWLVEGLEMLEKPGEIDDVLRATPDAAGVLFAPALTGLGAPRWIGEARGTILGLHRGVRRTHVLRAALEGVAHQVADILDVARRSFDGELAPIWADGGLAASTEFLKLQADLAGSVLRRSSATEATTRGVAAIAAVRAGLAPSLAELVRSEEELVVAPSMEPSVRAEKRERQRRLLDLVTSREVLALSADPSDAP